MANQCTLTSKDLTVVEDQLTRLATGCRAAQSAAGAFQNPQLKTAAMNIAQHHRQQFDALFAFLNGCQ